MEQMKTFKVAIDGPAGAGKSTIAKAAAGKLGFVYIDTGAMYRAIGLFALRAGVETKNAEQVIPLLDDIKIAIRHTEEGQQIDLNGENVSEEIRKPEVSVAASNVAVIPEVRLKLVELQRMLAQKDNVIMDGRDIGTYVLPDADIKIFLTASVDARAKRRLDELEEKGIETTFAEVKQDMEYRDQNDASREFAPLKAAEDSILLDSTELTLDETTQKVLALIEVKRI